MAEGRRRGGREGIREKCTAQHKQFKKHYGHSRDRVGFGVRTKSTCSELGNMHEVSIGLNLWATGDRGSN